MQAGSLIVENLRTYRQPVMVYLPPGAELRGGAWVVIDGQINPTQVPPAQPPHCLLRLQRYIHRATIHHATLTAHDFCWVLCQIFLALCMLCRQHTGLRPHLCSNSLRPDVTMGSLRPDVMMGSLRPDVMRGSLRPDVMMGRWRVT